ncbi:MFS transporter [Frankia sp. AvcI1]|uniref:MFS transporter n=2 Tax=Frankia sp. AvcI1 TaxID=573496 RepID=UPI00211993FD|nr:MFS transporter [Frankia sp. AvcI1]
MSVSTDAAAATRVPPVVADDVMTARQRVILVLLLGSQFMLAVDFSILNVALPSIGAGVGLTDAHLQWVATAFALPAAGFTLLFGRVADLAGRRRMLLAGLALLVVSSLVGGLATSPAVLLGARVGQGLAAAMTTPAALALLLTSFPPGRLRQRALGMNGALISAGFTTGALAGGLLTGLLSWRWAFLVNVPVAAAILLAAPRLLPAGGASGPVRLDVPGALTVTGGLLAFVYGIATGGNDGWADPVVWGCTALGVVLLAAFWRIETTSAHPLASVAILRRRAVGWGNAGGFAVFALESSVVFLLTLYLQQVLGFSATTAGLVFGLPGAAAFVSGMVAPRLMSRRGSAVSLVAGLAVQGLSNAALAFVGPDRNWVYLVLAASAIGFFGHVHGIVAYLATATGDLPDHEQGLATALTTMTQQVALTVGIPILSTVATARSSALAGHLSAVRATLAGIRLALVVDAALTLVVAAAIAAALLPRRRSAPPPTPSRARDGVTPDTRSHAPEQC